MKKLLIITAALIFAMAFFGPINTAIGQSPTAAEEESEEDIETIERIKDLVASKVAELDLVERRGLLGMVKSKGNTQLTLTDHVGNQRTVDIDELTEFENGDEDDFGISDIDTEDTLSVIGLYNKDNERMLARFISLNDSVPVNIDAKIMEMDEDEFTITAKDTRGQTWTVDIETSTDTSVFEEGETSESGFSRLEVGQRIIVVGFESEDEEGRMSATRIIHFTDIPPARIIDQIEAKEESKVSSGSAGNVEVVE